MNLLEHPVKHCFLVELVQSLTFASYHAPRCAADLILALMAVVVDPLIVVDALMRSSSDQAFQKVLWPCGLEAEIP